MLLMIKAHCRILGKASEIKREGHFLYSYLLSSAKR